MKGYKASIKGKCRNQIYEVGKTYKMEFQSEGEIELCQLGFHFCKNPDNVFKYYKSTKKNLVLFEVEAIGDIKSSSDKSVTDEMKIIREVPKNEYNSLFTDYEFKFDSNNNMIYFKNKNRDIWEYKYDSNNNLIWRKDYNGDIWEYKYDEKNNLIWSKDLYNNNITEYKYDSNNNLILEKDLYNNITEYKYDKNNNLIWYKDYNGNIWEYKYDKNNNLIWEKNFAGLIWKYPSYKVITY